MSNINQSNTIEVFMQHGLLPETSSELSSWISSRTQNGKIIFEWRNGACLLHGKKIDGCDQLITSRATASGPGVFSISGISSLGDFLELALLGSCDGVVAENQVAEFDPLIKRALCVKSASDDTAKDLVTSFADYLASSTQPALAQNLYGKLLQQTQKYQEACLAFRTAIEKNHYYSEAYSNFGSLLWASGSKQEGFVLFTEAALKNPFNETAWLNFFDAGYELGLYQDMEVIVDHVRKTSRAFFDVLTLHHSICRIKQGKVNDAILELTEYLAEHPEDADAKQILEDAKELLSQERNLSSAAEARKH